MRDYCHESRSPAATSPDTGIVDDLERMIRDYVIDRVYELGVAAPASVGWDGKRAGK